MFDEIVASGHAADEYAYAGLANCYRHMPQVGRPAVGAVPCLPRACFPVQMRPAAQGMKGLHGAGRALACPGVLQASSEPFSRDFMPAAPALPCPQRAVPDDAEQLLLGLIDEFKAAWAAAEGGEPRERQAGRRALLVVVNAVINSLAELGWAPPRSRAVQGVRPVGGQAQRPLRCRKVHTSPPNTRRPAPAHPAPRRHHQAAVALFKGMPQERIAPDHTTYSNIIRSYMQQALGRNRQPASDRLSGWHWGCRAGLQQGSR